MGADKTSFYSFNFKRKPWTTLNVNVIENRIEYSDTIFKSLKVSEYLTEWVGQSSYGALKLESELNKVRI